MKNLTMSLHKMNIDGIIYHNVLIEARYTDPKNFDITNIRFNEDDKVTSTHLFTSEKVESLVSDAIAEHIITEAEWNGDIGR